MVAINGTSTGYLGSSGAPSIDTVKWASLQHAFGQEYFVSTSTAGKVTVVSGTTVRVAAGVIGGRGVVDTFTGTRDLTLPTPGTDGTIHYLVAARRTWQTTQATTIEYVTGTSARAIPAGRNVNPGVLDDHPLGLVAVTKAGATVMAVVVDDLRAVGYGSGSYEATSDLVLSYMNKPGYRIRIGTTEWLRGMDNTWSQNVALPRWGALTDFKPDPEHGGTTSAAYKYYWGVAVPPKPFRRMVTFQVYGEVEVSSGGTWQFQVEQVPTGTENVPDKAIRASQLIDGGSVRRPIGITTVLDIPANESHTLRAWLKRQSGSITIWDNAGYGARVDWIEVSSENNW